MPREWLIQHRAGTLAEWAAAEASGPVLLAGERAYITDLNLDVVGDGVTKVASLGAVGSGTYAPIGSTGVNPADVGFDIIVVAGQSNMWGQTGATPNAAEDPADSRVWQYAQSGTYSGKIIGAADPLAMPLTGGSTPAGMGPTLVFARWYAASLAPNRRVLIVPVAVGATTIQTNWDPAGSGNLYTGTIATVQAALTAAGANARVAAILWLQGESDAISGYSGASYQAKLDALISGWRTAFGSASTPFIVAGMVPEFTTGTAAAIRAVHSGTPARVSYTGHVAGPSGSNLGDNLHYTAAAQRTLGRGMFAAYRTALTNVPTPALPGQVTGLTVTPGNAQAALSWSPVSATPAVTDYVIEYKLTSGSTWSTVTDGVSAASTATVTGLTNGSSYDFRASAVNSQGTGAASAVSSATPAAGATVPGAPQGLFATPGNAQVALTWSAPASNGGAAITDYVIQYRTTSGPGAWQTFADGTGTGTSATVTGLTSGTGYDFQVAAVNSVGTGAYSSPPASATPIASIVTDSFTGTAGTVLTSHAGETGATWTKALGSGEITLDGSGVGVTSGSVSFTVWTASGVPATADYLVRADVKVASNNADTETGVAVRCSAGAANRYQLCPYNGNFTMVRVLGTTAFTPLMNVTPAGGVLASETYRLTIAATGSTITGTIQRLSDSQYLSSAGTWQAGATTAMTVTDANITAAGNPAVFTGGAAHVGATVDNFVAI